MDHHENNNLPAADLYDGAPADWVAYVQTLPPCYKCNGRPIHLPGASRCLGCLENRPGPQRRAEMWHIIHEGGHYCSSCYIREAPELGQSCPRCVNFRLAAKLLRKLSALLVPAVRKLQMAHEAAESARNANTPLAAVQHAIKALATVVNVCKSLVRAGDILRELPEVDAAKADAARPNYRSALGRYREVAPLVQNIFVLAATGLAALPNENQGLAGALSNIDNFMPQIPPQQQGEIHNPQAAIAHEHHDDHQHHVEDPLGENNNFIPSGSPQHFQANVAHQHHHNDHEHQVENPAASTNNNSINPPHFPQLPDGHEKVHDENLPESVPQQPNDNQQDQADLVLHDFGPNFDPRVVPEQCEPNYYHVDDLLLDDDNLALEAALEQQDDGEDYPDDILFVNDYLLRQQYNQLPPVDN